MLSDRIVDIRSVTAHNADEVLEEIRYETAARGAVGVYHNSYDSTTAVRVAPDDIELT